MRRCCVKKHDQKQKSALRACILCLETSTIILYMHMHPHVLPRGLQLWSKDYYIVEKSLVVKLR